MLNRTMKPQRGTKRTKLRLKFLCLVCLFVAAFCLPTMLATRPARAQNSYQATLSIRLDQPRSTISRHIYGQFAEHLGRLIYDGLWVGENSSIPNTRGLRNDVVGALKELHVPVLRWPGGCFATNTTGATALARATNGRGGLTRAGAV